MRNRATIERIHILNGGIAQVDDASIYSPGVCVGEPMSVSCNAYLLTHRDGWLIWDTGTQDGLVSVSGGWIIAHGIRGIVTRTIPSHLEEIGVPPARFPALDPPV